MDMYEDRCIKISREELYELVWNEPMSKLAKQFDISDRGLTKKCKRHNIPTPSIGYWRKLETGHKVKRPKLPKVDDHYLDTVIFEKMIDKTTPVALDSKVEEVSRLETARHFSLPKRFSSYHPAIQEFKNADMKRTDRYGQILHGSLLDVKVTTDCYKRTLRFLQGLFQLCNNLDWKISSEHQYDGDKVCIVVDNEKLCFKLKEKIKQVEHEFTEEEKQDKKRYRYSFANKYDYIATGILTFSITNLRDSTGVKIKWTDSTDTKLENRFEDIIKGLTLAARVHKVERLEREEQERLRKEKEASERELQRLNKIQEKRVELLLESAEKYARIKRAREFIAKVEVVNFEVNDQQLSD